MALQTGSMSYISSRNAPSWLILQQACPSRVGGVDPLHQAWHLHAHACMVLA